MLQYRKVWLAGGWLLVASVVYLSLTPHPPEPMSFPNVDKLEHGLAYAALSFWFCQIYISLRQREVVIISLMAMGIVIEVAQGMTGYRYFEYADMLANGMGVMLGVILSRTRMGRAFIWIEKVWRSAV